MDFHLVDCRRGTLGGSVSRVTKRSGLRETDVANKPSPNLFEPDIMLGAAFACHTLKKPACGRLLQASRPASSNRIGTTTWT